MEQRESFISYRSFHEALKDLTLEQYGRVMYAINEYALYQNEIELSGIEKTCFILIKPQLEANIKRQENGKYGSLGGRPKKTENPITTKETENKNPMGYFSTENKNPNDNENVNVNDNDKERDKGEQGFSLSQSQQEKMALINPNNKADYAKPIFDILEEAGLPCCNKNFPNFLCRDWMNAVRMLNSPVLKGLHSDEVIGALKNYVLVINHPNVWSGWKNKKSFDVFVAWEHFKDFLPDRFCLDNFLDRSIKPKQTQGGVSLDRLLQMMDEEKG